MVLTTTYTIKFTTALNTIQHAISVVNTLYLKN